MELPHVINCGVFQSAEKRRQYVPFRWIAFSISGLKKFDYFYPDGTLCATAPPETAFLSLAYPGFFVDFEYGSERENWVMMLEYPIFDYEPADHRLYLQLEETRITLPVILPVQTVEIPVLRENFARISQYSLSALPADRLKADIAAAGLFLRFLPEGRSSNTRAEALKKRLDADRGYRCNFKEHCAALKLNADCLRREFVASYGITPGVYRERQRRNDLLALMTYSNSSLKEIAEQLGLKHVQHLNVLTEKYFHRTPGELLRRFRNMHIEK